MRGRVILGVAIPSGVSNAGPMSGELARRDRPAFFGKRRHVSLDRHVEIQLVRLDEQSHRVTGQRFRDAPDLKHCRPGHRLAALDAGVTLFDTADIYGNKGGSESFLGETLAGRRADVVIATKFGGDMGDGTEARGSREYIRKAIEGSLQRLRTDYVDLYQYHTPDHVTPFEETFGALDELVGEGKVRYVGASNYHAAQLSFTKRMSHRWQGTLTYTLSTLKDSDPQPIATRGDPPPHGLVAGEAAAVYRADGSRVGLLQAAGGEALADTQWSILTKTGDVVKENTGALPTHILALGDYAVVANHNGESYTSKFSVTAGEAKQIEVVMESGPASPEALKAITEPPPPPPAHGLPPRAPSRPRSIRAERPTEAPSRRPSAQPRSRAPAH